MPLSPSFASARDGAAASPVLALALAVVDVVAARVETAGGTLVRRVTDAAPFSPPAAASRGWSGMRTFRRRRP